MKNEQSDFEEDLVKKAISDVIENNITNNSQVHSFFMPDNIDALTQNITNELMKEILKSKKLFKYSITTLIQQKNGSALNYCSAAFNEDTSDGIVSVCINDHPYIDIIIVVSGVKITQK